MELATPNNESVINHEESLYLILADVACVGGVDQSMPGWGTPGAGSHVSG